MQQTCGAVGDLTGLASGNGSQITLRNIPRPRPVDSSFKFYSSQREIRRVFRIENFIDPMDGLKAVGVSNLKTIVVSILRI